MMQRKIMLLGEMGVGKTSIVRRLVFDRFEADYKSTIGADIYTYDVEPAPGAEAFRFLVWDTDGSFSTAIFRSVHVRQAHAALVIGDVGRRGTLDTMLTLAEGFADALPGRYVACVLNKLDTLGEGEQPVVPERLTSLAFPLFKTSAKTGENVKPTFAQAAATIVRRKL